MYVLKSSDAVRCLGRRTQPSLFAPGGLGLRDGTFDASPAVRAGWRDDVGDWVLSISPGKDRMLHVDSEELASRGAVKERGLRGDGSNGNHE